MSTPAAFCFQLLLNHPQSLELKCDLERKMLWILHLGKRKKSQQIENVEKIFLDWVLLLGWSRSFMSQAKIIRCLPELFLNNNVVNPDFLKNRSLFFFQQNNELFWNRCTELSEMSHQRCSVTVALSVNAYKQKATREFIKEQPIYWELITLGYSWKNSVCMQCQ